MCGGRLGERKLELTVGLVGAGLVHDTAGAASCSCSWNLRVRGLCVSDIMYFINNSRY